MSDRLIAALAGLDEAGALALARHSLDTGVDPLAILQSCREGMARVGQLYEQGEYFVSDLILAGEIFRQAAELLAPRLGAAGGPPRGAVVVGTVQGDLHNIGKDLVVTLLRAANYAVHDLGIDVPAGRFVEAAQQTGAVVVGMSGLLTTSFDAMRQTAAALAAAGLRPGVRVMIGGGPVTARVCEYVGADAWAADAQAGVALCGRWIAEGAP